MRLAGVAVICALAAFGAAFLVARAVNRQTPARAATTRSVPGTTVAAPATIKADAELVSRFNPVSTSLRRPARPHRRHMTSAPPPVTSSPVTSASAPAQTTTAAAPPPVVSEPQTPASSSGGPQTSSQSSSHRHSGGGSGTTTIG